MKHSKTIVSVTGSETSEREQILVGCGSAEIEARCCSYNGARTSGGQGQREAGQRQRFLESCDHLLPTHRLPSRHLFNSGITKGESYYGGGNKGSETWSNLPDTH